MMHNHPILSLLALTLAVPFLVSCERAQKDTTAEDTQAIKAVNKQFADNFSSDDSVQAQQEDAVLAAIERHYAAIHAQDIPTVIEHHLPDFTWFSSDGRLLMEAGTAEAAASMGANLDFGTVNVYMSYFNAQIYGDVAVATFYLVGTHAWGGETKNGTWRVTAVWLREGGEWKEAHHHESPLMGEIHP